MHCFALTKSNVIMKRTLAKCWRYIGDVNVNGTNMLANNVGQMLVRCCAVCACLNHKTVYIWKRHCDAETWRELVSVSNEVKGCGRPLTSNKTILHQWGTQNSVLMAVHTDPITLACSRLPAELYAIHYSCYGSSRSLYIEYISLA